MVNKGQITFDQSDQNYYERLCWNMLCQRCQQNPATIHLTTNVNGKQTSIDLCSNCYQEIKAQNEANGNDPFGFGALDNFFKNNQNQNANDVFANSMKTQAGGNRGNNGNSVLGKYGLDLTAEAKAGRIDPVIGRDAEIARVIEILNRRTKNNPVLVGEAGVGKTAVVEGLAQKIVDGDVPAKLLSKKVIRLDVVSLVQGTSMRGEFEKRIQSLMEELKREQNVILFIDEIHEIVGAGDAQGGMDAGNILKPSLARGEFQLVGATTLNEFRTIEKDAALARRLQPVKVNEPSVAETLKILKGIQPKYEAYHHVKYEPSAIEAAVKLSDRYIQDRFLPDKAIDLLDEAGSRKNLTIHTLDPKTLDEKIKAANEAKQAALNKEDYEKAAFYRDQARKFTTMKETQTKVSDQDTPVVSEQDMEKIVEEMTKIPVGDLKQKDQENLRNLASSLKAHVIGQDKAVTAVTRAIQRNRIGFNKTGRPIGSFLFVGPTGVGKTETAKQLAYELFGSTDAMIRFDMSEYMEKHSVAKLIGSPPGYVGYEEAGQLTEQVRRHPYSLVLLDEVEKAHPDVMHMFLQILDDGRLTDAQGRTVSFKDTIIIMTSNAGSGDAIASVGFGAAASGTEHSVNDKLTKYFKPEFLNRFDDIVEFAPLQKADLLTIVKLMLEDTKKQLAAQAMTLTTTPEVNEKLVALGYNPKMGARPLRRVIQEQIEDKIADFYLAHPSEKNFAASLVDDEIVIKAAAKATSPKPAPKTDDAK